jgi:hypothetical protein
MPLGVRPAARACSPVIHMRRTRRRHGAGAVGRHEEPGQYRRGSGVRGRLTLFLREPAPCPKQHRVRLNAAAIGGSAEANDRSRWTTNRTIRPTERRRWSAIVRRNVQSSLRRSSRGGDAAAGQRLAGISLCDALHGGCHEMRPRTRRPAGRGCGPRPPARPAGASKAHCLILRRSRGTPGLFALCPGARPPSAERMRRRF